jgi:4-hydroxy-3-methylbut-2-enyl diphosphate reductase
MKIVAGLREKYPNMRIPSHEDICFATKNRQDAVKALIEAGAQKIIVVGSRNSSNSTRLSEVARRHGADTYFVDSSEEMDINSFYGAGTVGVTSGASVEVETLFDVIKTFIDRGSKMELVNSATEKARFKPSEYGKNYYNEL